MMNYDHILREMHWYYAEIIELRITYYPTCKNAKPWRFQSAGITGSTMISLGRRKSLHPSEWENYS